MQTDSVEKAAGIGAIGLWAALHGWLGWLVVLYAACMMLDCLTGTAQAIKNGEWSSHKARQGLWHKGGSIIMVFVSVLTDILLGLTLNHISGLTLKNLQDNRFTLSTVLEKYNDIYVIIDNLPKGIDQTPYWYSIYERNRSNPIVFGSNRDYLLLRDMHAQMVMLMVVYVALVLVTGLMDFSEPFIFYILFMIGALNVGARVQGKRVVYNVLSVDINAKKDE
ncbi:phage holin family protein [Gemmiger formicilis]|uniref:phage holin family protein n=1 Tax=Gemmiger formicilis TaxID=745368 RepID=UPI00243109E0|nr:phage holin family protein [Gemmiger formicilis]